MADENTQLVRGLKLPDTISLVVGTIIGTGILLQGFWASVLALLGTFDQLTNYAVFSMWIFYILTTSAVFVLRRKMPEAARPYKTLGYPVTPLIFILVGIWLLINTLQTSPMEAGIGLLLISLGIPVYFYFRTKMSKSATEQN